MKCALHFSNGVFNSLAPVKRGDNVDQLRKTEWMEESERGGGGGEGERERVRETHSAFWFRLPRKTSTFVVFFS